MVASGPKNVDTQPTTLACAHSIQIGWNQHLLMDLPARYLNHSCDPNIGVIGLNDSGSYDFVALNNIECNEVIIYNSCNGLMLSSSRSNESNFFKGVNIRLRNNRV